MDLVDGSEASTSRVIDKLVPLLTEESRAFTGIAASEVESLKAELELIRDFIRVADERSERGELGDAVKDWLEQSKEVAELVEDFVDECILKESQRQNQRGFVDFLGKAGRLIGSRQKLSFDIRNIKELLRQIQEQGKRYGLTEIFFRKRSDVVGQYPIHSTAPVFRGNSVGIDTVTDELIDMLVEGTSRRSVISLVGVGGIGKTTLAKAVYDAEVVRRHFDYHAWISVTPPYNREDLLSNVVRQIGAAGNHVMQAGELVSTLTQYLQPKRYLIVFDDVWHEQFWHHMEYALPENEMGSRVIITTRSGTVAASCKVFPSDHVHRVEPLSEEMCLELFRSIAFQHEHYQRPSLMLEYSSLEFVRKCEGLPLAIVAIAGLLSTKEKATFVWERLLHYFDLHLKSEPHLTNVSKILSFSFRELPYRLKLCFLYFTIFGKSTLIPNDELFKLWIAEGFVQVAKGKTLEEVAEAYLNELIQRNLVQACEGFYGLEKFCRLHDFMHEIAAQKADEFKFCHIRRNDENSSFRGKARRLSISNNIKGNILDTIGDCEVRSVFLSNLGALNNSFLVKIFRKYRLLTLLAIENVPLDRLPEEVGNLTLLKYLSLKNTKLKSLPEFVGKLQNLQTLDLRNTLLVGLPIHINKLQNLRHLLASGDDSNISLDSTQGVRIKEGIGCLENLQTLMTVEANLSGVEIVEELKELRQLRRLSVSRLTREVSSALCACIWEMRQLESLSLHSMTDNEIIVLENSLSAPWRLQRLILKGRFQWLPDWNSRLQNLSLLYLSRSGLIDDPLVHISCLPNLACLWLYRAYEGEKLHFDAYGFQNLKLLVLRDLQGLEVVEIEQGALPFLEELRIGPSPLLNEVPSGIQHLRSLKVLAFYDMPNEFVLRMQPDEGSSYMKIEHVPSVLFLYRVQGRRYASYELGDLELLDRLQGLGTNINDAIQRDLRLSFCSSDGDRMSFSSDGYSIYTDDIVD